ncbi:hypothetical protein SAMN04487974_106186 [Pelagibacterium luteolum]|uniref:Uncharacterized protein n=1 Tax=Pelagibacterium luteolum TaxID=440168 RepID=A0A1G7WIC1_9HYPH|nr:hypothetical protein SAMN04487974_106186 [Pelagibacterium luteolum]
MLEEGHWAGRFPLEAEDTGSRRKAGMTGGESVGGILVRVWAVVIVCA